MNEIIERFVMPLINGFWSRYHYKFKHLDEDEAKANAIVLCWEKFDNFDPSLGFNSLSYFTQIVSRFFFKDDEKEVTYRQRYVNESAVGGEDSE